MAPAVSRRWAGLWPAAGRTLALPRPVSAAGGVLLAFSCGTSVSAALQRVLLEPHPGTQRLVELNLGEMFGTAAVCSLILAERRRRPALTRVDLAILILGALTWCLPEAHAVYAGMTLVAVWLLAKRSADRLLAGIGQIWLALAFCELWSKLAFKLLYHAIEPWEVAVIAGLGRWAYPTLHATGVYLSSRPGWSIVMLEGCSAFHNLSLAAMIWLCVLKIAGRQVGPGALGALAVSAGLVVAINIARILAMLPSSAAYQFWHNGTGSVFVAVASAAASVLPIVVQIERTPCPAPPCA
ncbi:hypothetical protein [Methylobacterium persicinum]|uniref:Exosortase/archaeosortase family protein n=1 Tax=Methylobacterium persicinum TaxID=374426 RepID=A0ABU0HQB1_9HYPH|nr:hypothetical protein [Methylobacterium persicinum]MDQ0444519.1 hypothetical protein [Methylobacterium persicinum]GJE40415.1 hypothetical protein KHHGKMAE_4508 [Methylobacterium persicinum]